MTDRTIGAGSSPFTALAATDASAIGNEVAGWFAAGAPTAQTRSVRFDVLRGALLRLGNLFHVEDPLYGAVGNGVTDDSTAINAAITAANATGGVVLFSPGKTYLCLSLVVKSNVTLDLRGATLQKNGGAAGTCVMNLTGATTATTTTLTSNAAIGDTALAVTSSAGFSVDDLVLVFDSTFKYSTSGRNQEISRVLSTGAGTITLERRLIGSYATASTATIVKLSAIERAHILGGKIVIPSGTAGGGIYGVLTDACTVEHVRVIGPNDMPGIRFDQSRGVKLLYGGIRDGQTNSTQGTSYGWILNESCHNGLVQGVETQNIRENPISNNCRHITVDVCTDEGAYDNSFNTHGTGNEHVTFSKCKSLSPKQYGFGCSFSGNSASDQNVTFDGCEVWRSGSTAFQANGDVGKEPKNIIFYNCKADGFGVSVASSAGLIIQNALGFKVIGGDYSGASIATNTTQGIYAIGSSDGEIIGTKTRDIANGFGIQVQSCTDVLVEANRVKNVSSSTIRSVIANTRLTIRNNVTDVNSVALLGGERVEGNQWSTKFDRDRGATSVADGGTVAHNCRTTPTQVRVTPSVGSQMVSVTALGASTFTVAIKTDAGAAGTTQTVYWEAEV